MVRVVCCFLAFAGFGASVSGAIDYGPGEKPQTILGGTRPLPAYILADGAEIREAPKARGKVVRRAKFLTPYYVAKGPVKSRGEEYLLLATSGKATVDGQYLIKDFIGWARVADCLVGREAIKNEHGIYRKALIVNDPKRLKGKNGDTNLKAVSVLNGPGQRGDKSKYDELSQLGLYDFFYIFGEVDRKDGRYLLLGDRPEVVSHRKPQEAVLGWVNDRRVFRWDTRQAIEFDKENLAQRTEGIPEAERGVKVFGEKKELEFWLRGIKRPPGAKEPLKPVAEEDTKVTFWKYNWPRYPVLGGEENPKSRTGKLLQIGFIGDTIYVDSDKEGMKAREVAESVQTIEQVKKKLKNIDLFFVIDSTGSMKRYFASAAKAVKTITEDMNKAYSPGDPNRPRIRYSVLFYRDYVDERKPGSYLTKRLPLTDNPQKVIRFLKEEPAPPEGAGGDEPEAVYHGVYTAISSAQDEMPDVSYRAAVLLGDKGNHPDDVRGYDPVKLSEFLKENGVDFYAIHVVDDARQRLDPDVRLFRDQVSIIYAQLRMAMNASYYVQLEPNQVAKSIVDALGRVRRDAERVALMADELKRGKGFKELKKQYGLRLTDKFSRMMLKAGMDPEMFVNSSIQVFGQGWVSELEPKTKLPQVKEVILTNRTDFEVLVGYMAGFIRKEPTKENVRKLWTAVLKANLGEFDAKKTVAELIQNHTGLPIRMKLLHRTLVEISNLSPREFLKVYEELSMDLRMMRGVLSEQDLSIVKDGNKFRIKRLGFHRYWWEAHGQEFAWIPLNFLP